MEGDAAWDAAPSLNLGRAGNRQEFDSALLPPITPAELLCGGFPFEHLNLLLYSLDQ